MVAEDAVKGRGAQGGLLMEGRQRSRVRGCSHPSSSPSASLLHFPLRDTAVPRFPRGEPQRSEKTSEMIESKPNPSPPTLAHQIKESLRLEKGPH